MTNKTWKDAEDEVADFLRDLSDREATFAFHRYPDARSAGGRLGKQPSDWIVCRLQGQQKLHWHLEAKETASTDRIPKSKIRQYGMLRKFWWAGVTPLVLVKRSPVGDWVVLGANELFSFDECPPSFRINKLKTYPSAAAALTELLK